MQFLVNRILVPWNKNKNMKSRLMIDFSILLNNYLVQNALKKYIIIQKL